MTYTILPTIRRLSVTRAMRVLGALVLAMCSVTWLAQAANAASGQASTLGALALQEAQAQAAADQAVPCDEGTDNQPEGEPNCESPPIFILDETHDIKLFLLKDLTHAFPRNNSQLPRIEQSADVLRRPSETFRPPDFAIGIRERLLAI